jgi:hypothetical protein
VTSSPLRRFLVRLFVVSPARRAGPRTLGDALSASAPALEARFRRHAGRPKAHELLRHVIGMERWGQRRLRVALGDAPFVRDEHHPYKPPGSLPTDALVGELAATRAETVALARRVDDEGKAEVEVEHNALGPLSAAAWLRYLRLHADLEARRLGR